MAQLKIQREWLEDAKQRGNLTDQEKAQIEKILGEGQAKSQVSANVGDFPSAFLHALLDDGRLTPNQRAIVSMEIHGMSQSKVDRDKVYETVVETPVQFGSMFSNLGGKSPNIEMFWNGRWYPVIMHVQFLKNDKHLSKTVLLYTHLSICEISYCQTHVIHPEYFLDDTGHRRERTILDVLNQLGLRKLQTTPTEFNLKLLRAERMSREMGSVVMVTGPVLKAATYAWWSRIESQALGTKEFPRKGAKRRVGCRSCVFSAWKPSPTFMPTLTMCSRTRLTQPRSADCNCRTRCCRS
jgi:hypothetical protein